MLRSLNYSQIDAYHNEKVKVECHEVTRIRAIWKPTFIYASQQSGQHSRVAAIVLFLGKSLVRLSAHIPTKQKSISFHLNAPNQQNLAAYSWNV
jgi:hypothetical protein